MRRSLKILLPLILGASLLVPGSATAAGEDIHCVEKDGRTITLPVECATSDPTIQAAVDRAEPGDAVLIGEGIYNEAVEVATSDLIIRGVDRNNVRLYGDAETDGTQRFGIRITGSNVEVSNLTAHHYTNTAVFWVSTTDYRGRYLTTYNNRLYGVYALDSVGGLLEDSYASGNADAGFYIGQCNPCHAVIQRVDSVNNALGYSGTNASNHLTIRDSRWIDNGGGILPNTLDSELFPPQCCIEIVNNEVIGSGNLLSPAEGLGAAATGIGIGVSGGSANVIRGNTVENCTEGDDCASRYGIAIFPFPDVDDVESMTPNVYWPNLNRVEDNTVSGAGVFDLALAAPSGEHNCFSGNATPDGGAPTSDPPAIQDLYPCVIQSPLRNLIVSGSPISTLELVTGLARFGARNDYRTAPPAPFQPSMPDPLEGLPT